jgi:5-methylcytosine-specific restriction endonuclease McrA
MPKAPATYQRIPPAERERRWASRRAARRSAYQTPGWKWLRKQVLARDAWRCRVCGRPVEKYAQVDHVKPAVNLADVVCDTDKCQTLCPRCHSIKTRKEMNARLGRKRFVVTGPAGAGKTLWVKAHARPGDLVWDTDEVARTVFNLPSYPRPDGVALALMNMRDALLRLASAFEGGVYVIVADTSQAQRVADSIGAEVIELTCTEAERQTRLKKRNNVTNLR